MNDHSQRAGLATLLRQARLRAGLSQRALSLAVGRSTAYISKVEAGDMDPSFQAVSLLAVVLNLSPLELWVLARVAVADGRTSTVDLYTQEAS